MISRLAQELKMKPDVNQRLLDADGVMTIKRPRKKKRDLRRQSFVDDAYFTLMNLPEDWFSIKDIKSEYSDCKKRKIVNYLVDQGRLEFRDISQTKKTYLYRILK